MDPSALIFVALAVAWAVYLIPKALQHHDEAVRSRSVERFSHTMRVLARREPVGRREARLVVTPGRSASVPTVSTKASTRSSSAGTPLSDAPLPATPLSVRRAAAQRAARRRRRVLGLVLLANTVVIGLAVAKVLTWPWVALPATLLLAWLVACRVMVKGERAAARRTSVAPRATATVSEPPSPEVGPAEPQADAEESVEERVVEPVDVPLAEPVAAPVMRAPGSWDMVPTTLPTYVSKPAATRRTVQTIDLESTGVWSSGRSESDSALAREAEQQQAAERSEREAERRRATGS
ncbi:hypothetical protein ASG88_08350 [Nocardioides sp. Soil777]|uniref:divisome protein SepX/GlpR n=1 Tax=Nocardioides sp. Soil777 TaxID=1736409 RepID=UPI000702F9B2|nr:hypothetical protein [Nocardioides sp. Soil777]KRF01466.1 hypothetical protein ASG88_08350 [Nocardioides sp. Soil777]